MFTIGKPNLLDNFSQNLVLYRDQLLLEEEFGDGMVLDGKESVQEKTTESEESVMMAIVKKRERTKILSRRN